MMTLPSPVQSVLELFQGPLASVRFADIDAAGLSKLAAEVEAAAGEVRELEGKLGELRQALAQRQEALHALAQQALAYARVYAENDDELLDAVNRITLPRAAKPRKAAPSNKSNTARGDASSDAGDAASSSDARAVSDAIADAGDAAADDTSITGSAAGGTEADVHDADAGKDASPPAAAPVRGARKGRAAASQRATN
jgi:hypothetical protein